MPTWSPAPWCGSCRTGTSTPANTSLYYAANKLLPAKTRVFVDFVVDYFRRQDLARRFSAFPTG